jgi:hypothetical protein
MERLRLAICLLSFVGLVFSLNILRYLTVFHGDGVWIVDATVDNWLLLTFARLINGFLDIPAGLTADYRGILFHLHAFGGVLYLVLAPVVLLSYRAVGRQRGHFAITAAVTLLLAAGMALWPVHFLANVHRDYDVSFFIILTIESIWLVFWVLAVAHALRGDSRGLVGFLAFHFALSVGAVFYRIVYVVMANFGEDSTIYLDRDRLVMRYHTAWFLALVLSVLLIKFFLYRLRGTRPSKRAAASTSIVIPAKASLRRHGRA